MFSQLLTSVILDQSEKYLETSIVRNQEADVVDELESAEVQVVVVMAGLKSDVTEASDVPKEFISETVVTLEALNNGVTCINMNLISKDDFDYTTLNHKSQTPHKFLHPINLQNTLHSLFMYPLKSRIS